MEAKLDLSLGFVGPNYSGPPGDTVLCRAFSSTLVIGLIWPAVTLLAQTAAFSDKFDRPDGPVGNGWTSLNVVVLSNGVVSIQTPDFAPGAISRQLAVSYPVSFLKEIPPNLKYIIKILKFYFFWI